MGLHPVEILNGYEKASGKALSILEGLSCYSPTPEDLRTPEKLTACIKTSIASKQFGLEDFLSELISKAAIYALPKQANRFTVENVRVQKILGGGIHDSMVVHGMVVIRGSETTIRRAEKAKVAVFNTNIEMNQGETKGTVLMKTADDLLGYTKGEEDKFEGFVAGLAEAGI